MNDVNANCCNTAESKVDTFDITCPVSAQKGKEVKLITLKSLLIPSKLVELDPTENYYFCKDAECDVVYFSQSQSFLKKDLKVRVHQKEEADDVPICYCFDWTAKILRESSDANGIASSISEHTKAGRCGCEVNNPQGSCCLGNVNAYIKGLNQKGVNNA